MASARYSRNPRKARQPRNPRKATTPRHANAYFHLFYVNLQRNNPQRQWTPRLLIK